MEVIRLSSSSQGIERVFRGDQTRIFPEVERRSVGAGEADSHPVHLQGLDVVDGVVLGVDEPRGSLDNVQVGDPAANDAGALWDVQPRSSFERIGEPMVDRSGEEAADDRWMTEGPRCEFDERVLCVVGTDVDARDHAINDALFLHSRHGGEGNAKIFGMKEGWPRVGRVSDKVMGGGGVHKSCIP